ncbi:MAG: hypothetical protein K9N05_05765 [Candidatus Marinimicrobia bacterium]|nr:hypothetical protein [Candidatus Neomarinimicrobiota bacterium]
MKRSFRILVLLSLIALVFAQEVTPKNSMLKSIVLPGWGELSNKSNSAYIFLGTEAALWLGFAGLRYSAHVQNIDIISYSRLHGGLTDYPDNNEFWADMGNYMSYADHEEDMLENRTPQDIWSTDYQWEWESNANLLTYDALFRKKELTLLSSEFVLTGLIVNRIASIINVRYLKQKNMQISAFALPTQGGAYLQLGLSF